MQGDDNLERLTQWLNTQDVERLKQWLDEQHITPDTLRRLEELLDQGGSINDLTKFLNSLDEDPAPRYV
jgi:cytosine/adenosine deaminase-related metal-dependent hydrolase